MTSNFDIGELARAAQKILDAQTKGQEFMLNDVHNQTRNAYERFPEDPVIRQVAFTIEKMADSSDPMTTISQSDVSYIYNNFVRYANNSKFRSVLGHLLLEDRAEFSSQNTDYTKLNRVDAEDSGIDTADLVDKNLSNALSAAFDNSFDHLKAYDEDKANRGREYVELELQSLGFQKPNVEVMGGDQNSIAYAAHFETRKGRVTVAIPIELSEGKILLPSTFVADNSLRPLTSNNLNYFISAKTESDDFSVPSASNVLQAVGIITGRIKEATESDASVLNELFGEQSDQMAFSAPGLYLDRKYEEGRPDIDTRQTVEMPQELAHLARDFEDDLLEAASSFGKDAINNGKSLIASELSEAGFKGAQVKFGSEANGSVVYLATIHSPKGPVEIEVPVEMAVTADNKVIPLYPKCFAYDGMVEDFIPSRLQRFAINLPAQSTGNLTMKSAMSYMTLPELKDEVLKGASDGDYVTCESALDEIQEKYTEEDFKNAVADYHFILMHKTSMGEQEQRTCSRMIPAGKGSIYPRCGHFGIPMSQIIVDAQGYCKTKTAVEREKLNPSDESGASISSAKVFMS